MASKIIVIGAVQGQLRSAFTKIATLHGKNSFTFAIISGDLFAEDDDEVTELLDGKIIVPLPTYFTVGLSQFPQRVVDKLANDDELCENLHYLGKRSTTKTSEGVRIVALGGQLDDTIIGGLSKEQYLPFHTLDDAKALRGANTADILLTACWPSSIRTGSKVPIPEAGSEPTGNDHISQLCAELKPRYHFSSSPTFYYEREPFFHTPTEDAPDFRPITRFISLAAHGNPNKQKSISAFNLRSMVDVTAPLPLGATASPFSPKTPTGRKRAALDPQPYSRFSQDDGNHHRHKRGRRERQPPPGPDTCFFCLSNPNLATHLVTSIGEDAYATTAKGPLTTSSTNAANGLDFPAHILIIPLSHEPTLARIDQEGRQKTYTEMNNYKRSLQQMVAARSDDKLGSVTFEISRSNGVHIHWQFMPVPAELVSKGLVEAAFKVEAENMKYPSFENRDPGLGEGEGDFFRVWIWAPSEDNGAHGPSKTITMPFDDTMRFDLQFGRKVLAKLLGLEKRLQWRDCEQTVDEEKRDVDAFKAAFRIFDFTLEDKVDNK
ncbi:hypothetical protein V493_02293 [Pseudogymnoascus sp. VKM F-4281 (FW-2241)]|nr:hypothetical protein V493_02293 [Pseudogymnoascus sp. VKM F-4281 (FW-2241)]